MKPMVFTVITKMINYWKMFFCNMQRHPVPVCLFEVSNNDREYGDLLRFDPNNFFQTENNLLKTDRRRFGITHRISPRSRILLTAMKEKRFESQSIGSGFFSFVNSQDIDSHAKEIRYMFDEDVWQVTAGYTFNKSSTLRSSFNPFTGASPPVGTYQRNSSAYLYGYTQQSDINLAMGFSHDHFRTNRTPGQDNSSLSPKFGIEVELTPDTDFRLAYFDSYRRPILNDQTLEPTTIAGFNQFYDDRIGTQAKNYAVGFDYSYSDNLKLALEAIERDLSVPFTITAGPTTTIGLTDWRNKNIGFLAYWLPHHDLSVSFGVIREIVERDQLLSNDNLISSRSYKLPVGLNWFNPSGWVARSKLTYVRQQGQFSDRLTNNVTAQRDNFVVVDVGLDYRFKHGRGNVGIGVLNLFDEDFRYQDADTNRQIFAPERVGFMRLNINF